jgi:acyl-CoA dehydrogenase
MDLKLSERSRDYKDRLLAFMDDYVYPAELIYEEQMRESGDPHAYPPILDSLKQEARLQGLWNLFDPHFGPGLANVEFAPLAEVMGRSVDLAPEVFNCNAPDSGNMATISRFGTDEQKEAWLRPLLDGEIRSAFAMTEPAVASSDATNIETRIEREGNEYVLNGRKWWCSNAMHPHCRILLVMGKTDPDAPKHRQQSIVLVPIDTPGVRVRRNLTVFGYHDREGHAEILFENVRVPVSSLLAEEGDGFTIGQARLGPGRIHHCMRSIGMAERALELLCRRTNERVTFGRAISENANVRDWIAEARIELEMVRALVLKTAWMIDTVGSREAHVEIAAIKVAAPQAAIKIVDRAIQAHGGGGVSQDFPLAAMYGHLRTLRIADGPDEVHKRTIARHELRRYARRSGDGSVVGG